MIFAVFGGLYSNHLALAAALADARKRGSTRFYCLGDMGAFGPHPDLVFPLLQGNRIECVQGNYDNSLGNGLDDCQCGYTDPRDNQFAHLSYQYTYANTSEANREWLRSLPVEIRLKTDGLDILFCHGSPRRTNEFLWESTTSTHFLDKLATDYNADLILGTHSGIHWKRELSEGRMYANVGVLGRPENDGQTNVWYALVKTGQDVPEPDSGKTTSRFSVEFVPLVYDHERLAAEMRAEGLPEEFVETILTGWWTTCLEILPARERISGAF